MIRFVSLFLFALVRGKPVTEVVSVSQPLLLQLTESSGVSLPQFLTGVDTEGLLQSPPSRSNALTPVFNSEDPGDCPPCPCRDNPIEHCEHTNITCQNEGFIDGAAFESCSETLSTCPSSRLAITKKHWYLREQSQCICDSRFKGVDCSLVQNPTVCTEQELIYDGGFINANLDVQKIQCQAVFQRSFATLVQVYDHWIEISTSVRPGGEGVFNVTMRGRLHRGKGTCGRMKDVLKCHSTQCDMWSDDQNRVFMECERNDCMTCEDYDEGCSRDLQEKLAKLKDQDGRFLKLRIDSGLENGESSGLLTLNIPGFIGVGVRIQCISGGCVDEVPERLYRPLDVSLEVAHVPLAVATGTVSFLLIALTIGMTVYVNRQPHEQRKKTDGALLTNESRGSHVDEHKCDYTGDHTGDHVSDQSSDDAEFTCDSGGHSLAFESVSFAIDDDTVSSDGSTDHRSDHLGDHVGDRSVDHVGDQCGKRYVLRGVSGVIRAGSVTALMGPSGAGKSSLFDALFGTERDGYRHGRLALHSGDQPPSVPSSRPSSVTPSVQSDGARGDDGSLQSPLLARDQNSSDSGSSARIGLVHQRLQFVESETTFEVLQHALEMHLIRADNRGHFKDASWRRNRVLSVLRQLRLIDRAHTRVSVLSGGERRRVAIGAELVRDVDILLLDEPLSGLDSRSATRVFHVLHALAHASGVAVAMSVHQPSPLLWRRFDTVICLTSRGRMVYGGEPCQVGSFVRSPAVQALLSQDLEQASQATLSEAETLLLLATLNDTATAEAHWQASDEARHYASEVAAFMGDGVDLSDRSGSDHNGVVGFIAWCRQVGALARRDFRRVARDRGLLPLQLVSAALVGMVFGTVFWQVDLFLEGAQNRFGGLFFLLTFLAITACTVHPHSVFRSFSILSCFLLCAQAVPGLANDRKILRRERAAGIVRWAYYLPASFVAHFILQQVDTSAFLTAKVLADLLPLRIVPSLLLGSVAYWMMGLRPDGLRFLLFMLVCILFCLAAAALCFLCAAFFSSPRQALYAATLLMLLQLLTGGLFASQLDSTLLDVLRVQSFVFYAYELLLVNEVVGITLVIDAQGLPQVALPGKVFLENMGFRHNAVGEDFAAVGAMCSLMLLLTYLSLRFRK
ncbi:MAG: hypothetical protein MHM6MM_002268 [Cercozoa sp. M6MM]